MTFSFWHKEFQQVLWWKTVRRRKLFNLTVLSTGFSIKIKKGGCLLTIPPLHIGETLWASQTSAWMLRMTPRHTLNTPRKMWNPEAQKTRIRSHRAILRDVTLQPIWLTANQDLWNTEKWRNVTTGLVNDKSRTLKHRKNDMTGVSLNHENSRSNGCFVFYV